MTGDFSYHKTNKNASNSSSGHISHPGNEMERLPCIYRWEMKNKREGKWGRAGRATTPVAVVKGADKLLLLHVQSKEDHCFMVLELN